MAAKKKAEAAGAKRLGAGKTISVKLVRSTIGFDRTQAKTVQGMGLRRINHSVELPDTPATRGMILKVRHLVEVSE